MSSLTTGIVPRELSRSRAGSSRCDHVGIEPRPGVFTPSPSGSRRPSHALNTVTQHLLDEWTDRDPPSIGVETLPCHIMTTSSAEPVKSLELGGPGDRTLKHILSNFRPSLAEENTKMQKHTQKRRTAYVQREDKEFYSVVFPWMHVTVRSGIDITLGQLKRLLFENLRRMANPQYSMTPEDYVFRAMCDLSDRIELTDLFNEDLPISRLELTQPFPMLFLYEPDGFRMEKDIAKGIGFSLGYPLVTLEKDLSEELKDCRVRFFHEVEKTATSRGQGGYEHYAFPEDKVTHREEACPNYLVGKIKSANLRYQLFYRTPEEEEANNDENAVLIDVDFNADFTPMSLIKKALMSLAEVSEEPEDFLLQLVGQKAFLTGDTSMLINYGSVRSALEDYRRPRFVLRRKDIVLRDYPVPRPMHKPAFVRAGSTSGTSAGHDAAHNSFISLWDIDEMLSLRPISLSNMGSSDTESMIYVLFGVYCGKTLLMSKESNRVHTHNPRWQDDFITLDLYMKDIPPAAVLCMSLIEEKPLKKGQKKTGNEEKVKSARGDDERTEDGERVEKSEKKRRVLGWVNVRLVDWKDELLQGMQTFSLWSDDRKNNTELLYPEGAVGQNDAKGVSRLMVELASFKARVRLPPPERYDEFVETQTKWGRIERRPDVESMTYSDPRVVRLHNILKRHLLGEKLTEDDEKCVWDMRHYICLHFPDALVILVECDSTWKSREHFAELYILLHEWAPMSIGSALTLLGKRFTDKTIRRFAVLQLDAAMDSQTFALFILPLVQALKCEPWSCSELALLLLRKALSDYRIGHKMFWILRAELADLRDADGNVTEEFVRLALIIEAYLRGNEDHIRTVVRQVEMVERLTALSVMVKNYPKDVASKKLREELRVNSSHFEHMDSPLDPTNILGELIIDSCRVLGSAKMPLRLCWKNVNPLSVHYMPTYEIIFKNGDDLRQDMLVLQVLEVMDAIWKKNNLDCCLLPYPVLPMGTKIGMIGVVTNCVTIFEIQSEGGKVGTAVKSLETTFINKFIRNHTSASKDYLECVDRFLMSCVGYSVATFIMGIKDRHNDNIMMTKDGKLFHIDFGHILGHGKTKLGIQRDRVPFVLTEHFLCVIGKGKPVSKESHDLHKFKQLCIDAYLLLWDVRALFVSLFTVMQGMELPELSTASDLDYLKKALCIEGGERKEAEKYFGEVFEEAFNGSWSTKTNWFFHTVKHL